MPDAIDHGSSSRIALFSRPAKLCVTAFVGSSAVANAIEPVRSEKEWLLENDDSSSQITCE